MYLRILVILLYLYIINITYAIHKMYEEN